MWRVDFKDAEGTTLYLSAFDGHVVERRNDSWRLYDIAWMLHIMDFSARQSFNHPLLVLAAAAGLWMALTGIWLFYFTLRPRKKYGRV